jgi:nucleoside-diphosphate-sugar epimerase
MKKVMITGVYGLIAGAIYNRLVSNPAEYDVYGLARRRQDSDRVAPDRVIDVPEEKFTLSDMQDLDQMAKAFEGMNVVLHMAADPSGSNGWESILKSNIIGGYHAFEACRLANVKRIVYASSIQASSGYKAYVEPYRSIGKEDAEDLPDPLPIVTKDMPTRPTNIYASSKVWGESVARFYSDVHGLSCLCIRIGWVLGTDKPTRASANDIWCSQRDIVEISECCVNAPEDIRYDVYYGMSDNADRWVDIESAREMIGYVARDRAEDRI